MAEMTATGSRIEDQINDIPLADEDVTEELSDGPDSSQNQSQEKLSESDSQRYRLDGQSMESIPSVYTNGTNSPSAQHNCKPFIILELLIINLDFNLNQPSIRI